MQRRLGAKHIEMADLRNIVRDGRMWCAVALVVARDGDGTHYAIVEDSNGNPVDVEIEIDVMPKREQATARLGAVSGGPGAGVWKIPPAGSEVLVGIPGGQLEGSPVVLATLSSQAVPQALDEDTMVLINPKNVILASSNGGKVLIGAPDGTGTQPVAYKTGSVDLGTWSVTFTPAAGPGVTSGGALIITQTPPGGSAATISPGGTDLSGQINSGSGTAEVKP